jgi:hypothetical protein
MSDLNSSKALGCLSLRICPPVIELHTNTKSQSSPMVRDEPGQIFR